MNKVRFWEKVEKTQTCWLWRSSLNNKGYGQFHLGSGSAHVLAHRYSLESTGVRIPKGKIVMHLCDNPSCVRPSHLKVATRSENQQDMAKKGRAGHRGERSPQAKLTEEQVRAIRVVAAAGAVHAVIAARYGVSRRLIDGIVRGTRWRHVGTVA